MTPHDWDRGLELPSSDWECRRCGATSHSFDSGREQHRPWQAGWQRATDDCDFELVHSVLAL